MNALQQKGQVMLLTTLVLSGTILAAIAIAGILMLYQIKASANAEQSAKAVFAADTGAEFELYKLVRFAEKPEVCEHAAPVLTNGAFYTARTQFIQSESGVQTIRIDSSGQAGKTFRSFRLPISGSYVTELPCQ